MSLILAAATYLWHSLAIQTNDDSPKLLVSMLDVEVDLVRDLWALCVSGLSEEDERKGQNDQKRDNNSLNAGHGCCWWKVKVKHWSTQAVNSQAWWG